MSAPPKTGQSRGFTLSLASCDVRVPSRAISITAAPALASTNAVAAPIPRLAGHDRHLAGKGGHHAGLPSCEIDPVGKCRQRRLQRVCTLPAGQARSAPPHLTIVLSVVFCAVTAGAVAYRGETMTFAFWMLL